MFNKLLRKKNKDKNERHKLKNVQSESSLFRRKKDSGDAMIPHSDTMPPQSTQIQDSTRTHSQDDMMADIIKQRQQKFAKNKAEKKRHSEIPKRKHIQNGNGYATEQKTNYNQQQQRRQPIPTQQGKGKRSTMNGMMSSSATNKRLQTLMQMRGGKKTKKDKGIRSRSINAPSPKQSKPKNNSNADKEQYTETHRKRSGVVTEPRRHSLLANKKKMEQSRETFTRDRRKTIEKRVHIRKVQYRVKNEKFELYEYYQPRRILGTGAYAVVCDAINTTNGAKCAVKKNKGVFDHITDARRILREIKLLMHFDHQDIMTLIDVIPPDLTEIDTFNDVYLVMPKMETTLAKVIRSKQKLGDKHLAFFMYQMLRGLSYMHSANVIHRDLKPENILINGADCDIKITDFGLARGVCQDQDIEQTEYVVTRWYRAPEVMCSGGQYDEMVDIWSLGCIFGELLLRKPLFPGGTYLEQLRLIFDCLGTPKDLSWIKTPEAKRWVQRLKPNKGKPLNQVFSKASGGAIELLSKMLIMDPNHRHSALKCIRHPYLKEYYRESDIVQCPPFDLSFEFEKAIKTKFGVRHMMYDALTEFKKTVPSPHYNGMKNNKYFKDDQKNDK